MKMMKLFVVYDVPQLISIICKFSSFFDSELLFFCGVLMTFEEL